jgi:hypothetical protein
LSMKRLFEAFSPKFFKEIKLLCSFGTHSNINLHAHWKCGVFFHDLVNWSGLFSLINYSSHLLNNSKISHRSLICSFHLYSLSHFWLLLARDRMLPIASGAPPVTGQDPKLEHHSHHAWHTEVFYSAV